MTVPNLLTILRIALTPLLVWFLLRGQLAHSLVVFLIAGVTDGLDGLIARLFQQKSEVGAYLDPLADKLLLVTCFLLLGRLGMLPVWLVVIAVGRDATILGGVLLLTLRHVRLQIRPSALSKLTTLAQLVTVFYTLVSALTSWLPWSSTLLHVVTAFLCVASGFQYVKMGLQLWEGERHGAMPSARD
jgi:cardiolipin synthase